MATVTISKLSFSYPGSYDEIFTDVSLSINTKWKLGLIGRNGRGKTTFLNLLMNKYEYSGQIISNTKFSYFPFKIKDKSLNSYEIAEKIRPEIFENYEVWRFEKEVSLLNMEIDILKRSFETLSLGEQTRILLAILFLNENDFLLIDEPTNNLDSKTRKIVAEYLNTKKGFILVSHDRNLIDSCVDDILSINKNNIEIQKGNYSSWLENKKREDDFELAENEKLLSEIKRLDESAKLTAKFAKKTEDKKSRDTTQSDNRVDKGFIGKKAAKQMKKSLSTQRRKYKAIEEKSLLLKNIDFIEKLKMNPLIFKGNNILSINNLEILYNDKSIFKPISFTVTEGDRIHLKGRNGSGKSSIMKLILGKDIRYKGNLYVPKNLKISYISQDTSFLEGSLNSYIRENDIDETIFKTVLDKLDFDRIQFEKNIEEYSEGQKKKLLLAKSLSEETHLYLWDEPLNYIDILSRNQIEDVILEYNPTMIFIEHDELFSEKIATKTIEIK